MAVVFGPRQAAADLVDRIPGLVVAAHNSHRCVARGRTAGRARPLVRSCALGETQGAPARPPLSFPHQADGAGEDTADRKPQGSQAGGRLNPLSSTVAEVIVPGPAVGAACWSARMFGGGPVSGERRARAGHGPARVPGDRAESDAQNPPARHRRASRRTRPHRLRAGGKRRRRRPVRGCGCAADGGGAEVGPQWAFGPDPGPGVGLPAYPWRRTPYRFPESHRFPTGQFSAQPRHPLIGARERDGSLEWRAIVDPLLEPAFGDHRVDGQLLLPGAAFLEMGLAVARDWAGPEAALREFEILQPLVFASDAAREILSRVEPSTATVEILSRPRLAKAPYAVHARGRIVQSRALRRLSAAHPRRRIRGSRATRFMHGRAQAGARFRACVSGPRPRLERGRGGDRGRTDGGCRRCALRP